MASYKGEVECLRLASFPRALKSLAFQCDLVLTMDVDKGWLREHILFKVEGSDLSVITFKKFLEESIAEYENR